MKVFAATALLALAAATHSASAANCLDDIPGLTAALLPLVADAGDCQALTKFNIIPPTALPTAAETDAICTKCTKLISSAKTVTFPACTLPIDGKDMTISELFNQIVGKCGAAGTPATTAPAGTAEPAATTEAPAATTEAPAATTAAPVEEGSASGSGPAEGAAAETVGTPAPTKAAASATTPAPKSAAAGVSATLGAAVAVAFSVAALVL